MLPTALRINASRFQSTFDSLAEIGATGDGGVHRPTFSAAHRDARRWFRETAARLGLNFTIDPAGNHSARLPSSHLDAPTLLLGSHLDSVPHGGRFDGALGVAAALEVLLTIQDSGLSLPVHLEAIDFTDEEGTLAGLLGSRAIAGTLTHAELLHPRGGREALVAGLERAGLTESGLLSAARPAGTLAGYLELHIEQGPRLVNSRIDTNSRIDNNSRIDIGIVTAITGITSYRLAFSGIAGHAGTTPMDARTDPSQPAAEFILEARRSVLADFPGCTVNVGIAQFIPGAYNIIPGRVELALEFRSPDPAVLEQMERSLLATARSIARRWDCGLEASPLGTHPPAPLSQPVQAAIRSAAEQLGLSHTSLASGAGHDAQSLAPLCPAGMIFIPSVGGLSHSPREFSRWPDCVNGANVLLQAVLALSTRTFSGIDTSAS